MPHLKVGYPLFTHLVEENAGLCTVAYQVAHFLAPWDMVTYCIISKGARSERVSGGKKLELMGATSLGPSSN